MNAEDAFSPTQDRSHFFASWAADLVLAHLQQGLDHAQPAILLTGEAAVGKSATVREATARWGARVRPEWLVLPNANPETILPAVVQLFGGKARGTDARTGWLSALKRTLGIVGEQDQLPLLIVEDAHTYGPGALTELAEIHAAATEAKRKLRIVLVGQPELEAHLEQLGGGPLSQLIAVRCKMAPLSAADVRHYLHHRLAAAGCESDCVFSRKASRDMHTATRGVPGLLDVLAVAAIRAAHAEGTNIVSQEHVRISVAASVNTLVPAAAPPPAPARKSSAMAKPMAPRTDSAVRAPAPVPPASAPLPPPAAPAPAPSPTANVVEPGPGAPVIDPNDLVQEIPGELMSASLPASAADPVPQSIAPQSPAAPPEAAAPPRTPKARANGNPTSKALPRPTAKASKSAKLPKPVPVEPPAFPEPPPLDSRHPRVKDWVSRFTENDMPIRFGSRLDPPPIADGDEIAPFPEQEPEQEVWPAPPADTYRMPTLRDPDPAPIPTGYESPAPPPEPEPMVLASDAVVPLSAKKPQPESQAGGRRGRRKRRQQARAAAQAVAAAGRAVAEAAARTSPKSADPAPAPEAAAKPRRVIVDESVTQDLPPLAQSAQEGPYGAGRRSGGPRPQGPGKLMQVVVPGVLMLGVAAIAILAGTRGGFERDAVPAPMPAPASAPEVVTTPATTTPDPSTPVPVVPDTAKATIEPAPPTVTADAPATDTVPSRFCLSVGTYLFSDRARIMARQLSKRTKLGARVETVPGDGARSYRILLGDFPTESAAEKVADRLLGRGIVSEAMVEPLTARQ